MSVQIFYLGRCHWLCRRPDANVTTAFRQAIFGFIVWLFAARCHKHLNDRCVPYVFYGYVKQSHRRRGNIIAYAVFYFEHIAINIFHAHRRSIIVNADIECAALAVIEESNHFALNVQFACQFALKLYSIGLSHKDLFYHLFFPQLILHPILESLPYFPSSITSPKPNMSDSFFKSSFFCRLLMLT